MDIHAKSERMVPGHILTGPIAIEGAMPGDVLEVDILDVQLRQDWGYNLIRPLAGTLPDDFHERGSSTSRSTQSAWSAACPGGSICRSRRSSA